jgi:pyruvate,water dikinase
MEVRTTAVTAVVIDLDDAEATDAARTGSKAANLARARQAGLPALPGAVLTTEWSDDDLVTAGDAWRTVSGGGARPVVVRSSSTGEDGAASSMAGVFDSVLDVADEEDFRSAVTTVRRSAGDARRAGLVDAPMAVLVQPMLTPRWGGVLFGADPLSGRTDRLVVAAVPGGPAALVSGEVSGWTAVLDRQGRVREVRSTAARGETPDRPAGRDLRRLARLAAATATTFGGPQDIEWAIDHDGAVVLLQARPITAILPTDGPVYGPGPVAESFPEPLAPLEQDLWLDPMRDGLREALLLAGTERRSAIERSPLVIAVDGMAAVDLDVIGAAERRGGLLGRLDPRPPARRLRAAWRVGRLRSAFTELATDVIHRVDAELLAVPTMDELSNQQLLDLLHNGRRSLVSLHGHEALAGLLIPEAGAATVTAASLALTAIAQARSEGVALAELVERDPVVLALMAPRIGSMPLPDSFDAFGATVAAHPGGQPGAAAEPHPAAVAREALRLRVRWVQELTARAASELGLRLWDVGVLPSHDSVRLLRLGELVDAAATRRAPADLPARLAPQGRPLPSRFRLAGDGSAIPVPPPPRRRRGARSSGAGGAIGVAGGVGRGPVLVAPAQPADVPPATVLVVPHLDPRLAPVIPRLAGLVAETGNALSHLAILAREYRVPVVVGVLDATQRFADGEVVVVDGSAGTVAPEPVGSVPTTVATTGATP